MVNGEHREERSDHGKATCVACELPLSGAKYSLPVIEKRSLLSIALSKVIPTDMAELEQHSGLSACGAREEQWCGGEKPRHTTVRSCCQLSDGVWK